MRFGLSHFSIKSSRLQFEISVYLLVVGDVDPVPQPTETTTSTSATGNICRVFHFICIMISLNVFIYICLFSSSFVVILLLSASTVRGRHGGVSIFIRHFNHCRVLSHRILSGLPRFLFPGNSILGILLPIYPSSFLCTCPYHLSLPLVFSLSF